MGTFKWFWPIEYWLLYHLHFFPTKHHTSFDRYWPCILEEKVQNVLLLTNDDGRPRTDNNWSRSPEVLRGSKKVKPVTEEVHLKSNQTTQNYKNKNLMLQMPQVDILILHKINSLSVIYTCYFFKKITLCCIYVSVKDQRQFSDRTTEY